VCFDIKDQLLIRIFAFVRYWRKKKWKYNEAAHQLFIDFKKAYDSVVKEILYHILREFGVVINLIRLIKVCLNELILKVRVCKHFSDIFPIENDLNEGDVLMPLLLNVALVYSARKVQKSKVGLKLNRIHPLLV
jgi:hypothetical protein